jgi:hypothetical protein
MKELAVIQQLLFETWINHAANTIYTKYNLKESSKLSNLILNKFVLEHFEPTTNIIGLYFLDQYLHKANEDFESISSKDAILLYCCCFLLSIKLYEDVNIQNSYFYELFQISSQEITLKELNRIEMYVLNILDWNLHITRDEFNDFMISKSKIEFDSFMIEKVQKEFPRFSLSNKIHS